MNWWIVKIIIFFLLGLMLVFALQGGLGGLDSLVKDQILSGGVG